MTIMGTNTSCPWSSFTFTQKIGSAQPQLTSVRVRSLHYSVKSLVCIYQNVVVIVVFYMAQIVKLYF